MWALRQRLLLIAGWVIAAVVTGLVSAGAVAVAGGQVSDRPLRPLSAAEVAALPVTIEDDCVAIGPLASGGPDFETRCSDWKNANGQSEPGDNSIAQPAEKEFPEMVEGRSLNEPARDPTFPEGAIIPDIRSRSPEPTVVDLVGGRVSVAASQGELVFHSATPHPGYVADVLFGSEDRITVTFWNGENLSTFVADVEDDGQLTTSSTDISG